MKWLWIVLALCAVGVIATALAVILGCGEESAVPREVPTVVEEPIGPRVGQAPVSTTIMGLVKQHPERGEGACRAVCEKVNGKLHRVGPARNRFGWECLCSWEE